MSLNLEKYFWLDFKQILKSLIDNLHRDKRDTLRILGTIIEKRRLANTVLYLGIICNCLEESKYLKL